MIVHSHIIVASNCPSHSVSIHGLNDLSLEMEVNTGVLSYVSGGWDGGAGGRVVGTSVPVRRPQSLFPCVPMAAYLCPYHRTFCLV